MIDGNLSLLRKKVDNDADVARNLDEIERATSRATAISQGMLAFSKGGDPILSATDILDLIKGVADQVNKGVPVTFDYDHPHDLWNVFADNGQVKSVVRSLIESSLSPMSVDPRIEIVLKNIEVRKGDLKELKDGRYVMISIRDHGTGFPPEVLSKVFDLYLTVRPGALGLELATAYATVRRHGGIMEAESAIGEGTVIRFYLPASDHVVEAKSDDRPRSKKGAKILVMDDEDCILEVDKEILQGLGYSVDTAHDGQEALEKYRRSMDMDKKFDVVIMDLTIPGGMGGQEAIAKLLEMDPEARAIVSSGYSNDPVIARYTEHGFKGVVPKPFKIEEMAICVADVLEGKSGIDQMFV